MVQKRIPAVSIILIFTCSGLVFAGGSSDDAWMPPDRRIIMAAGSKNLSYDDLNISDFAGRTEYIIDVADGRFRDDFPSGFYRSENGVHPDPRYDEADVMVLTILFDIDRKAVPVVLRMARAGAETLLVTLNGTEEHRVTSGMQGSAEGYQVGAFDLELGRLEPGRHSVTLEIDPTNPHGNQHFAWDAVVLFRD